MQNQWAIERELISADLARIQRSENWMKARFARSPASCTSCKKRTLPNGERAVVVETVGSRVVIVCRACGKRSKAVPS
jgi:hypothetical protein